MSGGGQPPGGPAPQPPPAVAAALEATRAKFNLMQQQQGARGGQPNGAAASARPAGAGGPVGSIPVGRAAGVPPPPLTSARNNPMFGEAAIVSPDKKVDREYTPKLADAIRAPSPSGTLQPDGALPPVGDLFAPRPALPAYLKEGASSAPRLPDWDTRRPYLTGRFLYDAAVDGKSSGSSEASRPPALDAYPAGVQESLLVDDLLSAFLGLSGGYVRAKPLAAPGGQRLGYEVAAQGQLEPALAEMAARMLPICEYVATIQRFVETRRAYEWGLVAHALAGAMRHVLQDWELMVAQLEHQLRSGKLTLQALWYYVQPPRSALKLVASLAAEASAGRLRGASLLDLLHARCAGAMGDAAAHRLALRLLRAAAEPYFGMLERWLCEGAVDDPYGEFMVQENTDIGRESHTADNQSAYWHERWTLRPAFDPQTGAPLLQQGSGPASQQPQHDVPAFLQRQKQLVLNTGKYLNVMRECTAQPHRTLPLGTHLEYDEGGRYALLIEDAHAAASSAAMELLRRGENLADGLAVLKRYFLTAQGDMLLHLMDAAEPEFGSPVGAVPLLQLQSLLESAVRGSSAASDPAAAHLAAAWDHRSILNMLIANQAALAAPGPGGEGAGAGGSKTPFSKLKPTTPAPMTASERNNIGKKRSARESFMLAYEVPWPLSIAAPEAALAQYQMVFRHIFELKWVERELNRVVALYAQTTGVASRRARARRASLGSGGSGAADTLAATLAHSYSTCQVMTHFFRQYLMYVTFEVMEPLWAAFEAKVKTASSLDEIVEQHKAFLRRLMKGCLLSRKVVVLRALLNLKELALRFVRLSDEAAAVNWAALEEEAEQKALGSGGRKTERQRELRLLKAALARSELERRLSQPTFAASISDLHGKFVLKVCEFINALGAAHKDAQKERSDTREELESLLNLMSRLDFNGYFSARAPPPPPKEEGRADGGLASAGSERMTVQFAQALARAHRVTMRLLSVLTPRGSRREHEQAAKLTPLTLPALPPAQLEEDGGASTPRRAAAAAMRLSGLSKLGRLLTPRARQRQPEAAASPGDAGLIQAYRPTMTAAMEAQVVLNSARKTPGSAGGAGGRLLTTPSHDTPTALYSDSDSESDAESDLSSLDGFGAYARKLEAVAETEEAGEGSTGSCPADDPVDKLPSPRLLLAPVQSCTPRVSARDSERAAEDLYLLLQAGELPGSRQRIARMLLHADSLGNEAFAGLPMHGWGFERCVALLLQLLLPLPLVARSAALAQLQSKLASQLLSYLGTSLERVLESERSCQRWCRLPYEVAAWLLEHGPCDRGETLFDLSNLWLEQQRQEVQPEQQAALAALVWRRPLAADFLRCMVANLPWAAQFVATSPLRPERLPPSLDGRFSFTAEFELHDVLELQQAALAEGRPRQQQSPAIYCGGLCWWAVLVANPRHDRFELYASCAAFSLFQEPFRAALQPAADVRFSFQGTTSLEEWRQSNAERLAAMHTHWGGPAFWVPPSCPSLKISSSSSRRGGATHGGGSSSNLQLAAAARPDTARGPRPQRQLSRLSIASGATAGTPGSGPPSSRSLVAPASSRSSRAGSQSGQRGAAYQSDADSGALTARPVAEAEGGLVQLSMDQVVAEVRRSCPYTWGATLRVRVNLKLLGGGGSSGSS